MKYLNDYDGMIEINSLKLCIKLFQWSGVRDASITASDCRLKGKATAKEQTLKDKGTFISCNEKHY